MTQIVGKEFQQIVGAGLQHPTLRPPAQGGHTTVAHQRLYQTGVIPPNVIAQMPAHSAAVALSMIAKGAHPAQAIQGAVVAHRAVRQAVGQALSLGNGASQMNGPYEVPLVGNGPREFPMGFGLTPVANGANQIINANPQVNFRPSRLVIPDTVAPSFMINDFKIGMRSQLVAPGALPAQSFTQQAVGTAMALDTVNVGQFVTLDVTNVSAQPANFAASLFGTTLNS
jgi:hypothetical protein